MQIKPPPGHLRVRSNKIIHNTVSIHYFPGKKKKKLLHVFLKRCNPANWFNEFRDIKITLEEFEMKKKR